MIYKGGPIIKVLRAIGVTIKDECKELIDNNPTTEDKEEAERIRTLLCTVLNAMGYPVPSIVQKGIDIALAKAIRDTKDGIKNPDNLIIKRFTNEIKKKKS